MQRHGFGTLWKLELYLVIRALCFTTGTYGSSNSDQSDELALSVIVLLMIYSPFAVFLLATDIYIYRAGFKIGISVH